MSSENTPLYYYAYGSNLRTAQLVGRTKGLVVPRGRATLPGHVLLFHKRSLKDGTGKADARFTGRADDRVIGALFEIPAAGKPALARSERGYREAVVRVVREDGSTVESFTYLADDSTLDDSLRPSADYRATVIDGALEQGLPADYIDRFLRSVPVMTPPSAKTPTPPRARAQGGKGAARR